eukprot:7625149-Pyramimonas_sp.AAC.1
MSPRLAGAAPPGGGCGGVHRPAARPRPRGPKGGQPDRVPRRGACPGSARRGGVPPRGGRPRRRHAKIRGRIEFFSGEFAQ